MKLNLIIFFGGLLCLPATYGFTREGRYEIPILIIIVIAASSCFLSALKKDISFSRNILSFISGTFIGEVSFFIYYYLSYGFKDQMLIVGIFICLIEFFAISAVGGIVVWISIWIIKRKSIS